MSATTPKQEFHCTSCGHRQPVRVKPRGCPVCHTPSEARAQWVDAQLAARLREVSGRVAVRA